MIHFDSILRLPGIELELGAESLPEAIDGLLAGLAGDPRVADTAVFSEGIHKSPAPAISESGVAICIPHFRTESVRELVMAAGRLKHPLAHPGIAAPLRLVFVAGIPAAFSSEYLRALGAIARICKNPDALAELLQTRSPARFLEILEEGLNPV